MEEVMLARVNGGGLKRGDVDEGGTLAGVNGEALKRDDGRHERGGGWGKEEESRG